MVSERRSILEVIVAGFIFLFVGFVCLLLFLALSTAVGMVLRGTNSIESLSLNDTGLGLLVLGGIAVVSYFVGRTLAKSEFWN